MATPEKSPRPAPSKTMKSGGENSDRIPSHAELLHELRRHGAKPPPPREIPVMSRRTRDYLLVAGSGSAGILIVTFRLLGDSDVAVTLRLALTGVGVLCGLLWFIFYGVMNRY